MNQLVCLKILQYVRMKNGDVSLEELQPILTEPAGLSPAITYIRCDFYPLLQLCSEGYIKILNNRKEDVSQYICGMNYRRAYEICRPAMYPADDTDTLFVKLTPKLSQIQSFLGFSLSDTIARYDGGFSARVMPVFGRPNASLKCDIFVIMPFQDSFYEVYRKSIQKVCRRINKFCMKGDDIYSFQSIIQDIWSMIYNSEMVIADCTGKNSNVMYELGIAHAIGKESVLLTQNIDDIPFDLRHLRCISYEYSPKGIKNLEHKLQMVLAEKYDV